MGSRQIVLAVAIVVAASAPASVMAAPSAAQRETARRLMDEGKERTRVGDKERAVEAYSKAHNLMKVPTTGIALARAHLALGHLVEARDVALEVARMPRDRGEPAVFEKSRREARELEASLKPRIPTVRIVVKGGPATKVTVDDAEVAPLLLGEPVALNPGRHMVVAKNAEGVDRHEEVELAERDGKEVELTLPVPNPALVVAAAREPATSSSRPLRTGEHEPERSAAGTVLVFGGFGLAAAGLVVGGVTGALTLSKAGSVKTQCENDICDPAARTDLDSASSLATISTIGFAVAGAGVVCGVVGLLLPKTNTETALHSNERRAAVWIGPGSLGVRGSF
jgi:hypothetical protein